jgi:acyl-CoA synthetase (AMP-forming)/AMP-acid ligase II
MFYISLEQVAKKFPNKVAVNNYTYGQLLDIVKNRTYKEVCESNGVDILFDVLKAASINKPIVVLPKDNKENIILPSSLPNNFSIVLYSSGSTGIRKPVIIPERMLLANINNILNFNQITEHDKILTVCSPNHTAGLTCQTLAGLFAGATVVIEPFNPFNLLRLLSKHQATITHVIPLMTEAVMRLSAKPDLRNLRLVWMGSDCIPKNHIEYWLDTHRSVMTVYGMTEAGPPAISHIYKHKDDLSMHDIGFAVGTKVFCDSKIVDDELYLKGDVINIDDWLQTGDCFKVIDGWYYYTGRKSAGGKIVPKGKH